MESGGVEQVVLELGKELSKKNINNLVISNGGRLVEQLEKEGTRHKTLPIGKKSLKTIFQIGKLANIIREEKPDILHIHSRVPAWVAFFALKTLPEEMRPATVTSVHGLYSVSFYSAIMTKGDRIIAVSECTRNYITNNYPKTKKSSIRVIPNSIDPALYNQQYRPSDNWLTNWFGDYPHLQNKYTLCLPGRLTRIKGHLDIIPIIQKLTEKNIPAHVVIVGEASKSKQSYKQELLEKFDAAGIAKHITWTGHRSDLINILSVCNVTLSLSLKSESFGKTTLEALALGKPVLGYSHGGVKELLETIFPAGLIEPGHIETATNKLTDWFNALPAITEKIPYEYTISGMIDAHINTYKELTRES